MALEWFIVGATVAGPILAVQSQKWIEEFRATQAGQRAVFYTLMATRATRLDPRHVEAINRIDLEFHAKKAHFWQWNKKKKAAEVIEAWRRYYQHLELKHSPEGYTAWNADLLRLFYELLHKMSLAVGFKFEQSDLQKYAYFPEGQGERDRLQAELLQGASKVFSGQEKLKMDVVGFPFSSEAMELQTNLQRAMLKAIEQGSFKIEIAAPMKKLPVKKR